MGQGCAELTHGASLIWHAQEAQYIPGPWLKEGTNELIFLEVEKSPSEATGECSLCAWSACTLKAVHALLNNVDMTKASKGLE